MNYYLVAAWIFIVIAIVLQAVIFYQRHKTNKIIKEINDILVSIRKTKE